MRPGMSPSIAGFRQRGPFPHRPVIGKRAVHGPLRGTSIGWGLTASQIWAMIDTRLKPRGLRCRLAVPDSGNQGGLSDFGSRTFSSGSGTIVCQGASAFNCARRHRVAIVLPTDLSGSMLLRTMSKLLEAAGVVESGGGYRLATRPPKHLLASSRPVRCRIPESAAMLAENNVSERAAN
jgi:hypothetical protein